VTSRTRDGTFLDVFATTSAAVEQLQSRRALAGSIIINSTPLSRALSCSLILIALGSTLDQSGFARAAAGSEPQGMTWREISRLPDFYTGVWDPVMGGAPPPATGGASAKASPEITGPDRSGAPGSTTEVAQRRCEPHNVEDSYGSPFPIEFLFTPARVTINIEYEHVVRRVYIGARHAEDPDPTFMGDSIGHWDHGTLVIDTIAIKSIADPEGEHSPHVSERIRLSAPDLLDIDMTVTRGGQSKLVHRQFRRQRAWTIHEYYCEENPRDTLDANGNPAVIGVSK
jgi:hypothetical protein